VIIWINGAFGAGKTSAAFELRRRLEHSFVYDPENIGYFFRKNLPRVCCTDDFQDMSLWRSFNYSILKELHGAYHGTVIVPMTLVNPIYYREIIQRLKDEGTPLRHFILYADRETILRRLKKRSLGKLNREAFAVEAIDRCLAFFDCHADGTRIQTDEMTVEEVAARIGKECGLPLLPDYRPGFLKKIDRLTVSLRHIRC